jgi:hypothetical protein
MDNWLPSLHESWSTDFFLYSCYAYAYNSRFIPERVADTSQIFLSKPPTVYQTDSYKKYCRRDRWQIGRLIAVRLTPEINNQS